MVVKSIVPISAKLVAKICRPLGCNALPFVAMRELLPDNIAMTEHSWSGRRGTRYATAKGGAIIVDLGGIICDLCDHCGREVSEKVKPILAYKHLITWEAQQHGEMGEL